MTSLGWLLGLLLFGVLSAVGISAPNWLIILFAVLVVVTVGLYLFAYVYFMFNDPEALRSERYALGRLAISKGIVGDDIAGIIELEPSAPGEPGIVPVSKGPSRQ